MVILSNCHQEPLWVAQHKTHTHTHLWKKHRAARRRVCVLNGRRPTVKRLPSDTSGPRLSLPLCLSARYSQSHYLARIRPRSSLPRADANTLILHLKRQKRRGADKKSQIHSRAINSPGRAKRPLQEMCRAEKTLQESLCFEGPLTGAILE